MEPQVPHARSVAVYCASSTAIPQEYLSLASDAGRAIAERGWEIVYGGGAIGMMGRCADAALSAGGRVTGVITSWLTQLEVAHSGVTELHTVETMHERKLTMTELADSFLILPGGFGTLDETFEAITWKQLGLHNKPIVLLNHDGYFDDLLRFLQGASARKFIRRAHLDIFTVVPTVEAALEEIERGTPWSDSLEKWWLGESEGAEVGPSGGALRLPRRRDGSDARGDGPAAAG